MSNLGRKSTEKSAMYLKSGDGKEKCEKGDRKMSAVVGTGRLGNARGVPIKPRYDEFSDGTTISSTGIVAHQVLWLFVHMDSPPFALKPV